MDANKTQYIYADTSLVATVRKMRMAQRKFRKEKNTPNYKAMIAAEQEVDAMVAKKPQPQAAKVKAIEKPHILQFG